VDYELGTRGSLLHGKLNFDINGFFFRLKNTIVQRIDNFGVFFYVNAGSTKQNGIEYYLSYELAGHPDRFITSAKVWISHAWHDFHYKSFKQVNNDFTGKQLPGVPPHTIISGLDIVSKAGIYLNVTYNYSDAIYLNDANTDHATSFNLVNARLGYRKEFRQKIRMEIFTGAENIFDTRYSLGNDINAAAGRYYNAAPGRNYYAGLSFQCMKAPKK
jgi:iron complex outermembrane receptor protein